MFNRILEEFCFKYNKTKTKAGLRNAKIQRLLFSIIIMMLRNEPKLGITFNDYPHRRSTLEV